MRSPSMKTVFLFALMVCFTVHGAELTTIDGSTRKTKINSIRENGQVVLENGKEPIDLQQLHLIETGRSIKKQSPESPRLYLVGGGQIYPDRISATSDEVKFRWFGRGTKHVPLQYARGLFLSSQQLENNAVFERIRELLDQDLEKDRALARNEDKLITVNCFVHSLGDDALVVEYKNEKREVPRSRLAGIVLARTVTPPRRRGHCYITFTDGSQIWGKVVRLEKNVLTLSAFPDLQFKIPWERIARIRVNSNRMAYASDLDPVSVKQKAIVTFPWTYQRDKDVMGNALELGGTEYKKGLGTHAECRLTYKLENEYKKFVATIGLDDDTKQRGDCVFQVYGDGNRIFEQRVRGTDEPRRIGVDIQGHQTITLAVIPGENYDIGDNANWCDARFIK